MSDAHEHDPVQGKIVHEYDGILEADNQLPRWWLGIFLATIAFSLGYWMVYSSFQAVETPRQEYDAALVARAASGADVSDDTLTALSQNTGFVARGRAAFESNCVACHGSRAEGRIGPNLTDGRWLHGGAPSSIYHTVRDGVSTRGMPAWGPTLGERQVQAVVAFVLTLRDTNVPGRAPEGEPMQERAALEAPQERIAHAEP